MAQSETSFPNRITDLYRDKTILVTGGTGFLGKVLIEKLLRTCTSLKKIFVIVRSKKGKTAEERMVEIFNGPLFAGVKAETKKVVVVSGDVSAPDLGLSPEDRRMVTGEAEIIYHSAASIRFDEPMKSAVMLNVRGTKLMLGLAEECKKLMVFCHLSTAYCHETEDVLFEEFYPAPGDPHRVIELCECLKEESLNSIAHQIRSTSANNYTFTKALAEALVQEKMNTLPVIIQRPTAVIPTWKEPLPGWTDNINGPVGLLIGAGKGVIRTMCVNKDVLIDCLPVDIIINILILSTYDYLTYRSRRVYNSTVSKEVKITIESLLDTGRKIITTKVPFDTVLWYPNGSMRQSRFLHYIDFLLFQLLPAMLLDAIFLLVGVKPFLLRVQKRVWNGYKIFDYYANREWDFRHDNLVTIRNYLNPREKKMFQIDSEGFDFYDYLTDAVYGARRYLLKEKDEGIPAAIKRMKMLWVLDNVTKTVIVLGLLYYMYKHVFASGILARMI